MFRACIFTLLALSAAPGYAAPDPGTCVELVPGRSLGRFSLGTEVKEASALVPGSRPGWMQPAHPAEKNIHLKFDEQKRLVAFEVPLPGCVTLAGNKIRAADVRILAAALGTCGPQQIYEGGNVILCENLRLISGAQGGAAPAYVAMAPSPKPTARCQRYLDTENWFDGAGGHPLSAGTRLEITDKLNLCDQQVLSPSTKVEDIIAPGCEKESLRGGTHVRCGKITYSFAGPHLALSAVVFGDKK